MAITTSRGDAGRPHSTPTSLVSPHSRRRSAQAHVCPSACPLCGHSHLARPFAGEVRFSLTPKGEAWLAAYQRQTAARSAALTRARKEGC